MSELHWIFKSRTINNRIDYDVMITINKSGKGHDIAVFRFSQDCRRRLAKKSEYLAYAVDPVASRVYFKECDDRNGFKLTKNGKGYSMRGGAENIDFWKENIGKYELYFDTERRLYYIALNNEDLLSMV